ncbi:ABC transporter permease [Cutibacterium avidum]|uniref:ABC transporter permease n=1 Tax=Cutibacterium avidum TaxID=33010 RepID=UPI002093AF0D|nr:ABC transporter permease [Cutibacterium avidum]MCO6679210.1 ABC transporter permease [Cutibacterium avidum]
MNWVDICVANARLWRRVQADDTPLRYWVIGSVIPLIFRSTVYVLIGRMLSGGAGMAWTFTGIIFLALTGQTISSVSDIPIYDVWFHAYPSVSRASTPVLVQYLARATILIGRALAEAVITCLAVGFATNNSALILPLLQRGWILLPAVLSCTAFGLAIIAPAIGNRSQDLIHNTAGALLVLTSGALLMPGRAPWLHAVGSVLPLQHAIDAMRSSLSGHDPWPSVRAELLVLCGWLAVAAAAYHLVDRRTRATGRGAMQG